MAWYLSLFLRNNNKTAMFTEHLLEVFSSLHSTFNILLWKYCQMRNQVTLREVGELGFLFYFILCWQSQMSSYSKFWAPSGEITGFLKGSVRDLVTGNMLVASRWAHTGVRDLGLFR
jgi:hypothetical protein